MFNYSKLEKMADKLPEPEIIEAGSQVEVRNTFVRIGTSDKNGVMYVAPVFEIVSDSTEHLYNDFSDFMWEPLSMTKAYEEKRPFNKDGTPLNFKAYSRNIKKFLTFCKCFDVVLDENTNMEVASVGRTGRLIVGIKSSEDRGTENTVAQYVV